MRRPPLPRVGVLKDALRLVSHERNAAYGPPTQDFQRTAAALNAYGYRGPGGRLLVSHDVAIMVICLKLSRLMWAPRHRDNWVDIAGYAACGHECAMEEAGQ